MMRPGLGHVRVARGVKAMKFAISILLFLWIFAGALGAWMTDDLDRHHLKKIARGPITLVKAINDNPVTVPTG